VTSIATSGMIYWAKALSSKSTTTINGVQFSTDGALLIAHSGESDPSFIVVFNSATGAVVSTRAYSTPSYYNYDKRI
jgi:hypothetical protein